MVAGTYLETRQRAPPRSGVTLDYNCTGLEMACRQMAHQTDDKGVRCDLLLLAGRLVESSREFPDVPIAVPVEALRTPESFYDWMQTFYKRSS